jgi:formylmethanofuran dehydrogenase subunit E
MDLPLPRKHPDIRHQERLEKRPKRQLYLSTCNKCSVEMLSVYEKEYTEKVYCEDCYQKEIYG